MKQKIKFSGSLQPITQYAKIIKDYYKSNGKDIDIQVIKKHINIGQKHLYHGQFTIEDDPELREYLLKNFWYTKEETSNLQWNHCINFDII